VSLSIHTQENTWGGVLYNTQHKAIRKQTKGLICGMKEKWKPFSMQMLEQVSVAMAWIGIGLYA
jgi:hypothetical protein